MHRAPGLALVACFFLGACTRASAHDAVPAPLASAPPPVADAAAPLLGHEWIEPVGDDARELAKVTVPLGATSRRPIVIALHGAGDRAEWACSEWRVVAEGFPFVVCPRGDRTGSYYDAPAKTNADLQLAIGEVRNRFDGWVEAHDPELLLGFSMGAFEALALVLETSFRAPSLALVEGGYGTLARPEVPKLLAKRGVERVLLACTTPGNCSAQYTAAKKRLAREGIEVHFVQAARKTHGMYEEVLDALSAEMPWLREGRAGFE